MTDHVYSMTSKDNISIKEQITDTMICEEWRISRKTQRETHKPVVNTKSKNLEHMRNA